MNADESRPVRRPPAVPGRRAPVRRPRSLARPDLTPGPQQRVRDLLYDLHEKAGRPALMALEKRIGDDLSLPGAPRKDVIQRIISRGGPADQADVRAVARMLARECGLDEHTVDARVTLLLREPVAPPPGPLLAAQSAYLEQVRRIAPPVLEGREQELAELAGFCLEPSRGLYVWWQAGPWAGKSALLSTFVLDPPETVRSRVQVVAFFITARLAGSDTRAAFVAAVTEQLGALTGQPPPTIPDEGLREAWLLDLLAQAAGACTARGMRLVLLVDGLDEDRSTAEGVHAHSIAGLLPGSPPAGLRVVVAGRPNPPVPDDVPDWHPLRDPGIVRRLSASAYARDLQRLGKAELKRLLKGRDIEQDLLGLLTAARGGLSGPDLQELTGTGLLEIEDVLHTVAGRTFTRRNTEWDPDTGPEVYLLGHEELQLAATGYLGQSRLAGYRTRLNAWADEYRVPTGSRPAWPTGTPDYLLRGYPRMLAATGDAARLVSLVTDPDRHDRMLDLSGGDAAALAEITTCQNLVLAAPDPDLEAMLKLCIRRTNLIDRNTNIPIDLPAVWAALGQMPRAEALARSIIDPERQARALVAVVAAVADTDPDQAATVADSIADPYWQAQAQVAMVAAVAGTDAGRAETLARSITEAGQRAQALAAVVTVVAGTDAGRAETLARSITEAGQRAQALAAVVTVVADTDPGRAETLADSFTNPDERARALAAAAAVVADTDPGRAETLAGSITNPDERARALAAVAAAVADTDPGRAGPLAAHAETVARSIANPERQARALVAVAATLADTDPGRAEIVARSIIDPDQRARAMLAVIAAVAGTDPGRAENLARSITSPDQRLQALIALARAVAGTDPHRAETLADSTTSPYWQAQTLAAVARAVAGADPGRAGLLAARAETVARSITDPERQARALVAVVAAIAGTDPGRAATLADSITEARQRPLALVAVAAALAGTDPGRAESLARSITHPDQRARALIAVAAAIAGADPGRAETLADSITHPDQRAQALAAVVAAVAGADPGRAETLADSIPSPYWQAQTLAAVTAAVVGADPGRAGLLAARAETVARSITDPHWQARALAAVAAAVAGTDPSWAGLLAARAETVARSITNSSRQAHALAAVAAAVVGADPGRAATLADSITNPDQRTRALAAVAAAVAGTDPGRAGLLAARAETVARSIPDSERQARALTAAAVAIAATGETDRAGRILGGVLAAASWQVSLPVLAEVRPAVVSACVDALAGNERPRITTP
ncbi:hypothetical protein [Actinoplanes sichuanensis]|uniref:NACHT domain-containing protein n=2 Tax=Actinoplanes sichuanensis TaxID=512349 RepID=A0ABW4A2W3_9ACTN